jgi:two-component system sensor histidine kinase ChiS
VCKEVRRRYPDSLIPIIMVSAKAAEGVVVEGLKAGCSDYVTKPFSRAELLARMETQLKLRQMWRLEAEALQSAGRMQLLLPPAVISRIKAGQHPVADAHPLVTVLFARVLGLDKGGPRHILVVE